MNQSKTEQATTNDYATLLKVRCCEFESVTAVLKNSAPVNSLDYKINVSNDPQGTTYAALTLDVSGNTEKTLTAGSLVPFDFPLYLWYDIQVKSTSPDNPAEANAWLHAQ